METQVIKQNVNWCKLIDKHDYQADKVMQAIEIPELVKGREANMVIGKQKGGQVKEQTRKLNKKKENASEK